MPETRYSPCVAFSFFLLMLVAGGLVVQMAGQWVDMSLARYAFFIALPAALFITYGYSFPLSARSFRIGLLLALVLAAVGYASIPMLDFTADGLGYQQSAAEAIYNGWNPLHNDSPMLWQNIYPSGAAETEASLAYLYGSIEATKIIQLWLLLIALPLLLYGVSRHLGRLTKAQVLLVTLCTLSTTVMAQILTHYIDSLTYLSGLAFIGGLLLYGESRRGNVVACLIMAACVLLVVNIKLSGIYHAFTLCAGAMIFTWIKAKRLPVKLGMVLLAVGLFSLLVAGFHPYVTNFRQFGITLFPEPSETFSGYQRPSTFDGHSGFFRYFYSIFSITGGAPHEPAQLKWPWELHALEWKFSGDPDPRTGGFGPFFALGFVASVALFFYAVLRRLGIHKALAALGAVCLLLTAAFPQSWWARYVPFGYAVPFILLLSLPFGDNIIRKGIYAIICIFFINSVMSATAAWTLFHYNLTHFTEVAQQLSKQPQGSVYLVPPVPNYAKYNGAYLALIRRLKMEGVDTTIKIGAPCPHMAEMYAEFGICY